MAHIGMKYPVFAKMNIEDGTYEAGIVVGKAIKYTGTPNKNDVELYSDDEVAETDKSIKDESISLNVDDLSLKVQCTLLGHTYTAAGTGENPEPESMTTGSNDNPPYGGLGFYKRRKKNGVISFTAIWLHKAQFSEPTEEAETKGDTTNFQTPTIEGKAYPDADGIIKEKATFETEELAKAWLNKKAGIV